MSQLKKAALLSYINLGISNIVGIVMTPFIVRMLGDSEYGLFALIGAFVGYLSILDLGLTNAVVRFVAQYRAQQDDKGQENFLAVSLIIYSAISSVVVILGIVMYLNVDALFGDTLTLDQMSKAKIMLLIFIFNIAIALPGGAFTGICNGYEHFVFPRVLTICKYVIRALLIVVILYRGADALGLVILDSILNVAFIVATVYYVFTKLKVRIKLHSFNTKFLKEIFSYSIWIFVFGMVYQFQWRTGQVILGATTSTVVVAIYAVGVTLGLYFLTFGNVINGLVLPKAVQSIYKNNSTALLTAEMIRISRITMIILFYILGGFLILGQEFVILWVGETYKDAWLVALLIMIAYVMPISQGYAHAILEAKKLMRFKSLSSLILTIIGIIVGGYLSTLYGLKGIIYGIFGALIILQVMVLCYYQFKLGLDMKQYFTKALFPYLLLFIPVCLISYYIFQPLEIGWGFFILKGILYTLFFVIGVYMLLSKTERTFLMGIFLGTLSRKRIKSIPTIKKTSSHEN
ncbi:oligosaccharide flippase family protein [uncultured Dokdonia sp.]|uniref:lipopolysaccharide biosynthesis protein n=1 Tax=uncultured Dokdonia sp. TaxID=575653 RepID=UPI0026386E06|nr:oligosaccharide flippase family protein [uncultured Dokdonia sp.]